MRSGGLSSTYECFANHFGGNLLINLNLRRQERIARTQRPQAQSRFRLEPEPQVLCRFPQLIAHLLRKPAHRGDVTR